MSKKTNGKLLQELLVQIAILGERMNNWGEKNKEDHNEMKETLKTIQKVAGDEIKEVDNRLKNLEVKQVQLSTTWKAVIFLFGLIPTVLTILNYLKII